MHFPYSTWYNYLYTFNSTYNEHPRHELNWHYCHCWAIQHENGHYYDACMHSSTWTFIDVTHITEWTNLVPEWTNLCCFKTMIFIVS